MSLLMRFVNILRLAANLHPSCRPYAATDRLNTR